MRTVTFSICPELSPPSVPRLWFAIYTAPRHEKQVAQQLRYRAVDYFLPLYVAVHQWKTGPARVELPLFPGYLFVHIGPLERRRVIELPGVVSIVGGRLGAQPLAEAEIEQLRRSVESGRVEPHPYLKVGANVRVVSGPLTGTEGLLIRKKGVTKVVLSIDAIMKSVAVEIAACDVEAIRENRSHGPTFSA
jgi:transcription antitermination factor NusG